MIFVVTEILAAAGAQGVKDASAEDSAVQVEAASPADRAGTGCAIYHSEEGQGFFGSLFPGKRKRK